MVSWQEAKDRLKKIKEERIRRSDEVLDLWENSLSSKVGKLGDEVWTIYEQVCIAALDCGRLDIAEQCLLQLGKKFPTSIRVRRLAAMRLEAAGKFDDAQELYEDLIKRDESDTLSRKRIVAILKAEKDYGGAISELNSYLKIFQNDHEAWLELAELYCVELDYSRAAFCMEEALIHHPHSHLHHQRYAEIRFAMAGYENVETARTHFAKAVKLCKTNTDALYGMCLCSAYLAHAHRSTAQQRRDNQRYAQWSANQLLEKHTEKLGQEAEKKVKDITILMDSLQI